MRPRTEQLTGPTILTNYKEPFFSWLGFHAWFAQLGERLGPSRVGAYGVMLLGALCPLIQLSAGGWPFNHEFLSFVSRSEVFARHFAAGDWLPVWSTLDNFGFGSPQPIFYHKLFDDVSGLILWLTGSAKAALAGAVVGFLALGLVGIYRCLRDQGLAHLAAACGGVCFALANYSTTNWLVRGALAEFSAAMMLPWVLLYFLRLLQQRRSAVGLGVSLWLTFLGHSVLAYYAGLLLAFVFLLKNGWWLASSGHSGDSGRWSVVRSQVIRALGASMLFLFLCAPWLAALHAFSQDYDIARILADDFLPRNQFQPWWRYIWDGNYHFGEHWDHYTVQLDTALLVLAVAAGASLAIKRQKLAVAAPLLLMMALALLLQLPLAAPFYSYFPGAAFIQFPWRLLALLTPCLVLLAFVAANQAWEKSWPALAITLLVSMAQSGALAGLNYQRFSPADMAQARTHLETATGTFSAFGEYVDKQLPLALVSTVAAVKTDAPLRQAIATWLDKRGCTVDMTAQAGEWQTAELLVNCKAAGPVVLPLLTSPYWTLTANNADLHCQSTNKLPGLCAVQVTAGQTRIAARPPTLWSILQSLQQSWSL